MKHLILISFLLWICYQSTNALEFQILHTNDIHSHLDHSIHRPELGGHGRLKTMLDRLRADALEEGIQTIAMDAGDFSKDIFITSPTEGAPLLKFTEASALMLRLLETMTT